MPLPTHPLIISGGCNCRAIRYQIHIPALEHRPLRFSGNDNRPGEEARVPMIATDHCNDCRRATGSLLPAWICTPISMVFVRCIPRSKDDHAERPWRPAREVLQQPIAAAAGGDVSLAFYESSEGRRRGFCVRCGTNLMYYLDTPEDGWADMLDLALGTVDQEQLEKAELVPERQLWWDCGIEWIKKMTVEGMGQLPRHATYKAKEVV